MKKLHNLLLVILVAFSAVELNAQCTTNGSFIIDQSALNFSSNTGSQTTTTCTGHTITTNVTATPGSSQINVSYDSYYDGIFIDQNGTGTPTTTVTYNFSTPVTIYSFNIGDIDRASHYVDRITVTAAGANVNVTSTSSTVSIESGNGTPSATVRATSGGANDNGNAVFGTDGPVSSITISYIDENGANGNRYTFINDMTVCCPPPCNAGTVSPTLTDGTNFVASTSTFTIPCGSSTADLSTLSASNLPSGANLTVHSGTPATNANKINSATALATGTYYVSFYDSTNDCYSPTTQITVDQETNCCNAGNVAPTVQ